MAATLSNTNPGHGNTPVGDKAWPIARAASSARPTPGETGCKPGGAQRVQHPFFWHIDYQVLKLLWICHHGSTKTCRQNGECRQASKQANNLLVGALHRGEANQLNSNSASSLYSRLSSTCPNELKSPKDGHVGARMASATQATPSAHRQWRRSCQSAPAAAPCACGRRPTRRP